MEQQQLTCVCSVDAPPICVRPLGVLICFHPYYYMYNTLVDLATTIVGA